MNKTQVRKIVESFGGPTAVALICEIESTQAVSMWIKRGIIPPARLMYLRAVRPDIFAAAEKLDAGEPSHVEQEANVRAATSQGKTPDLNQTAKAA